MPRIADAEIEAQRDQIIAILKDSSSTMSHSQIAAELSSRFGLALEARVLQHRLSKLAADGIIERSGERKGTRYRWTGETATPADASARPEDSARPEWLSSRGAELQAAILRPKGERTYVTYRREWLESYVPGKMWLLPEALRQHLHQVGRTPAGDRPAGTFARDILGRLLIDLSWASSHLEGNTYSLLDTQNLIEFGQRAAGKDAYETQMILNHKEAIEFIVARDNRRELDAHLLRTLHAILFAGLQQNAAHEGRLRTAPVTITGSTYIPTEDPHVIRECLDRIAALANAIPDPFERSFFLLVHLPYLQPFIDANKRTARVAANIPLIDANLCPLTFVDVPEVEYIQGILAVYEMQRVELLRDVYVHAYERSAERYTVVRDAAPKPDPLRLRYRDTLGEAIVAVVRGGVAPSREWAEQWASAHEVAPTDKQAFGELLLAMLLALNDASAARHGLRPSEFGSWREKFRPA
jgi:fido (protein-threonine AMPylation protein)